MDIRSKKVKRRNKIRRRIRSQIVGSSERPRLCVFKSNQHIYAQVINDFEGHTLAAASTLTSEIENDLKDKPGVEQAHVVGEHIAKVAKEAGINQVVFDRSGYKYHGQVKAVAEGAREGGLDL